ncbi:phosphatase PAP2 family protein [Chryseobacterium fluminis]|uniref:phosphatase PAP2 family protein n=1 Tax=Chryseobacterium fluminis TaxID=2983606 RepID=UPI00225BD1D5|nr:phosphatase PAP2 family protein [Chryseobacterium sp. MMS21-Ot14]UZU00178.1 phosphatase PAP2 family protein [Chryseobacterium sp. MMS21-Ot14]
MTYTPKIWESLLTASFVSVLFSILSKKYFKVPRPATVFDHKKFVCIGETLSGHNSFPSGHAITVFTTFTVLMLTFMPNKIQYKIIWCCSILLAGFIISFSRVAVGAHYPLDVIFGSIIGYISALSGIFINRKYNIWIWIGNRKYYPVFILLFIVHVMILVIKIINENLIVFYLSLISLLVSLTIITAKYVKK